MNLADLLERGGLGVLLERFERKTHACEPKQARDTFLRRSTQ
jgi:hypothetical protein